MRKLQVFPVTGMTALCYGDDVVYAGGQWMWISKVLIHRLSADAAHPLSLHDFLLVPLIRQSVSSVLIRPVALALCHDSLLGKQKEVRDFP